MAQQHFGIYRAQVASVTDPMGQGRVQLIVPDLSRVTTGWAMPCIPAGGPAGRVNVGDAAWVMFEGGDADYPVFMGVRPRP